MKGWGLAPFVAGGISIVAGCQGEPATPRAALAVSHPEPAAGSLSELANLDYSNGTITVFTVKNKRAEIQTSFKPGRGLAQGLAFDARERLYTTITASNSKPCRACVEVFTIDGKLFERLNAPVLSGASGPPALTDISVDAHRNVYVSDYGQQAVYFFPDASETRKPIVVVQNSQNAASVLATPDGSTVLVSGGCGFASVRPYARVARRKYSAGSCFGIGTIALIGGATDDAIEVMTPVDGVPGLVSVSSPTGGTSFHTPDRLGSISGVAYNGDASVAYVADARKEYVYAFARPDAGWLSGKQPKLLATYGGFKDLDIIAVVP